MLNELSFEQTVEALRPWMEFDGVVYTLRDEDASALARTWLAARAAGVEMSVNGSEPIETVPDRGTEQKRVYSPDTRSDFSSSASYYPHNNHADIYVSHPNEPSCTGFKWINNYTGATSAHCVHFGTGPGNWFARDAWAFGYSDNYSPYAHVDRFCYARTVPGCWANDRHEDCDYAVVRFRADGINCYTPSYDRGYLGYNTAWPDTSTPLSVAGYPGVGPYGAPSGILYYGTGYRTLALGVGADFLSHNVDTSGGQSGSPILSNSTEVRAINRGYFPITGDPNAGVRVTSELVTWFQTNAGF